MKILKESDTSGMSVAAYLDDQQGMGMKALIIKDDASNEVLYKSVILNTDDYSYGVSKNLLKSTITRNNYNDDIHTLWVNTSSNSNTISTDIDDDDLSGQNFGEWFELKMAEEPEANIFVIDSTGEDVYVQDAMNTNIVNVEYSNDGDFYRVTVDIVY